MQTEKKNNCKNINKINLILTKKKKKTQQTSFLDKIGEKSDAYTKAMQYKMELEKQIQESKRKKEMMQKQREGMSSLILCQWL